MADDESLHREYILDVRVVALRPPDAGEVRYRFEAPEGMGVTFEDPDLAERRRQLKTASPEPRRTTLLLPDFSVRAFGR